MNWNSNIEKFIVIQRYLSIALIIIGLPMLFLRQSPDAGRVLLVGLYMFFLFLPTNRDERAQSLKISSILSGFVLSYVMTELSNLFNYNLVPNNISAVNFFIISVLSFATVIYYLRFYSSR